MEQLVQDAIESGRTDVRRQDTGGQYRAYTVPIDIVDPYLKNSCAQCGKHLETCLACSQCGDIRYCGKSCQVANWKSIHKLYCKRHREASVGKLSWDNIMAAKNFSQITVTLREHDGLGEIIESAMGQVILSQTHLVQNAKLTDLKSMARVIARRLNKKDPGNIHFGSGLLTIVAAISTLASDEVDEALAETALFRCVARFYLHYASKLAQGALHPTQQSETTSQSTSLSIEAIEHLQIPLLSATVNLVHPKVNAHPDMLVRVLDSTWLAIEACCLFIYQCEAKKKDSQSNFPDEDTKESSNNSRSSRNADVEPQIEHLKCHILPNLRMLVRNLAYIGTCPTPQQLTKDKIQTIVTADFLFGMEDYDHQSIQVWATTAQNMISSEENNTDRETIINNDDDQYKWMDGVGQEIYKTIQKCAPLRLGGTEVVFQDSPPLPPGVKHRKFEDRRFEEK